MKNHYEILGVDRNASTEEIKKKYRSLALKMHPDRLVGKSAAEKKDAERKFQEITNAYDVLSDDKSRKQYDIEISGGTFGGFSGFDQSSVFEDILEKFFHDGRSSTRASQNPNSPRRGEDILFSLRVSFRDAVNGALFEKSINLLKACSACKQSGAFSNDYIKTCPNCNGKGIVEIVQRSFYGNVRTQSTCSSCKGTGKLITKKCGLCAGNKFVTEKRNVKIKLPRGTRPGQRLKLAGIGNDGLYTTEKGDLYIEFEIEKHSYFKKDEFDIHVDLPISFIDAIVGNSVKVVTIEGIEDLKIPACSQIGDSIVLRNKGFYTGIGKETRGDMHIWLKVKLPRKISSDSEKILRDLQTNSPWKPNQDFLENNYDKLLS